ncbi:MAG: hypothetical protein U9R14_01105 [Patescibacteria group bacterium]|nr:hypothetical protein [Patescibacteria group bacterium]
MLLMVSFLVFGFFLNSAAYAGWHDLTQSQRNQAIVDEAESWTTGDYGSTCKEWARTVVKNASDDVVNISSNSGNCEWGYHADIEEKNVDISSSWSGDLIQMQLTSTSGPHTAVILSKHLYGLIIRESNWNLDYKVNSARYITYDDFDDMVDCYTIYYIRPSKN